LRSYEGLFTNYVNIDENLLAKRANTKFDNIYKYLSKLASSKILSYIPRKTNPVIVFTEERLEDKALHITYEEYAGRKNRYVEKLESILNYASTNNKCRSQILLGYFGEKDPYRCGQCDVCQKRNELDISKYEFDLIVEEFKKEIISSPISLQILIDKNSQRFGEEKLLKVIHWLLDNGKIFYNEENLLSWKI
jgi:ATP-dependent DNA helicase RecQ